MKELKMVVFPQDESEHNHIVEWWYFNGNLEDNRGNSYAFMNTMFKADIKRIKLPVISEFPLPVRNLFFTHSMVSDIKRMKCYPNISYVLKPDTNNFKKPMLFAKYGDCVMEKMGDSEYRLKSSTLNLRMKSMKRPLLTGGRGFFRLPGPRYTYYYSLTDLRTNGTININGRNIKVSGKSWMDHQWANVAYKRDKWTWFSIQLDNGTDILCFEYGRRKKYRMACIMNKKEKQENVSRLVLIPTGTTWTSPRTKATYPLSWHIEIPGKGISLDVEPLVREQEMLFGVVNYWEGPLAVQGRIGNKKVKGRGFLELIGYIPKCGLPEFIKKEAEDLIFHEFNDIKQTAKNILG